MPLYPNFFFSFSFFLSLFICLFSSHRSLVVNCLLEVVEASASNMEICVIELEFVSPLFPLQMSYIFLCFTKHIQWARKQEIWSVGWRRVGSSRFPNRQRKGRAQKPDDDGTPEFPSFSLVLFFTIYAFCVYVYTVDGRGSCLMLARKKEMKPLKKKETKHSKTILVWLEVAFFFLFYYRVYNTKERRGLIAFYT